MQDFLLAAPRLDHFPPNSSPAYEIRNADRMEGGNKARETALLLRKAGVRQI